MTWQRGPPSFLPSTNFNGTIYMEIWVNDRIVKKKYAHINNTKGPWAGVDSASLFCCSSMLGFQWGWGQVTVEERPKEPGLLSLLWSSHSSCKALRGVWAHYPAAVWRLLHKDQTRCVWRVSEEWSDASPQSAGGSILFRCPKHPLYSLSCLSPYILRSVIAIHLSFGFISNKDWCPVIHCEILVFLCPPRAFQAWFPLLSGGLDDSETTTRQLYFDKSSADRKLTLFI